MSEEPVRLTFPNGLTTKQARRLADIGDALFPLGATELMDANLYDLDPSLCDCCKRTLEGGHCYACKPVSGYGEDFRCETCSARDDERDFRRQVKRGGFGG